MRRTLQRLIALCGALTLLSACGGGHGGGSGSSSSASGGGGGSSSTPTPPALTNYTTVTVDAGPSALTAGSNPYIQYNFAYVTITLCAPGGSVCQTIDHVQLDTGSVGLRIPQSVLNANLLAAMPAQTDTNGSPVGECYGYVDGYVFGGVRSADFQIGGEKVSSMPLEVIGDTNIPSAAPSSCTSGGGTNLATVKALGANGIIGVGTTATDCGAVCAGTGGSGAAIYYDCPSSGCGAVIARAASTTAPFQQLPNPVAAMGVDNNGIVMTLPDPGASGAPSVTGTVYFGIGTQTNNGLGSATVLTSPDGNGLITALYNGQTLSESFIDSGSNAYLFEDSSIPACTGTNFKGYYCPSSPLTLKPTLQGANGATATPSLTLYNAQTLLSGSSSALPGVGGNPSALNLTNAYPTSFDFGLPFFFGRTVYTAIEGRSAGTAVGPFYAF